MSQAVKIGVPALDKLQSAQFPCAIGSDLLAKAISTNDAETVAWVAHRRPSKQFAMLPADESSAWRRSVPANQAVIYASMRLAYAQTLSRALSEEDSPAPNFASVGAENLQHDPAATPE